MSYLPDDIGPMHPGLCIMEGCIGRGNCPRCGEINYRLLGWYGALARWAKAWGVTEDEADRRIAKHQIEREIKRARRDGEDWQVTDLETVLAECEEVT